MRSKLHGGSLLVLLIAYLCGVVFILAPRAAAQTVTESGTVSITAVVQGPPPSTPATITSPQNNSVVSATPLVVMGTCQSNLLVIVYNQGAEAGTGTCSVEGTFTINIGLLSGLNVITALNFDAYGRPGPDSAAVNVTVVSNSQGEVTDTAVLTPTERQNGLRPVSSRFSRNNIVSRVASVVGIGPAMPLSGSEQILYVLMSLVIILLCIDMLLFDAFVTKKIRAKTRTYTNRRR